MSNTSSPLSYLMGLTIGRGKIFRSQWRVLVEFPHKNPVLTGIAHCDRCGWLATGFERLRCKNPECRREVPSSVKPKYEQQRETIESVRNVIVPFLTSEIDCQFRIGAGSDSTHLILDLNASKSAWNFLLAAFSEGDSHHDLRIPVEAGEWGDEQKLELINGLLDTAGFANAGSWLPRDGSNGHGRMRLYFQIVRNWELVVDIDNFLRSQFRVPIQTIDWGHPNIRSSSGAEDSTSASTREHQIKIFPEYMSMFRFRVSCKQSLFDDLVAHNLRVGFDQVEDWFPPAPISDREIKPSHPAEEDPRMPSKVRRHFDKFWQINLALGCKYLGELQRSASNPAAFALTGDSKSGESYESAARRMSEISRALPFSLSSQISTDRSEESSSSEGLEFDTYEPLRVWLEKFLRQRFDAKSVAWITANQNLARFLGDLNRDTISQLEDLEGLRIRPDVVGYIPNEESFVFIESKIASIDISEIGQLLGYCLVACPKYAILVSTVEIDEYIKQLVANCPDLVNYGGEAPIQIVTLDSLTVLSPDWLDDAL